MKYSLAGVVGALWGGREEGRINTPSREEISRIKRYRILGRTGFSVSDIGTGSPWNEAILNSSLDAGINYIDKAEAYHQGRSEIVVAEAFGSKIFTPNTCRDSRPKQMWHRSFWIDTT